MLVTFYNDEAEHIKTNTTTIWHYTIEWEKKTWSATTQAPFTTIDK
jgi:hypothetical protein